MPGWLPVRRTPRERPAQPLRGHKLAHPMLSSDGASAGFSGVTLGQASVYGVIAEAQCAQGCRHRSPSRWCDCGFYCVHTLGEARALACDPVYRLAVLLDVVASGRYIRYERGLRYARQRVTSVRVGRCGCGLPAGMLVEAGGGVVGWRRLVAVCPACAGAHPAVGFDAYSRLLGGVPVRADPEGGDHPSVRASGPGAARQPCRSPGLSEVPTDALVPLLTAEVALLQARLDEVQRQLARLTPGV